MRKGVHSCKSILRIIPAVPVLLGLFFSSCGSEKKPEGEGSGSSVQENRLAVEKLKKIEMKNEEIIQLLNGPANMEDEGLGQQFGQEQGSGEEQEVKESPKAGQEEDKQQGQETKQSPQAGQGAGEQQGQQDQDGQQSPEPQQSPEAGQGEGEQHGQQDQGGQQSPEPQQSPDAGQGEGEQQDHGGQQSPEPQESKDPIQSPEAPKQVDDNTWTQVSEGIIELHTMFNEYMPHAIKLGAGSDLNDNAARTLNLMTVKAKEKKIMDVMLEANNLYKSICDFYALHREKTAPVKMDLYYARKIILAGMVSDWSMTDISIKELKSAWQSQKALFAEKQKEEAERLDYSIAEAEKVIGEKDMTLVQIKGKLLMQNIAELEKGMKQSDSFQGGQESK
jgi:hypothetical protein